ncbi:hypothetical protein [Escherichia coli]|uniref:hypothetical protein n=1 Tax=Escherichia coli TaxID=562 RepID=UPI00197A85C1|nr:hypothetical protein [Escherichia coli]
MKISKLVVVATVCSTLSACSVEEMAAVNKKISDGAFAVTKALILTRDDHFAQVTFICRHS